MLNTRILVVDDEKPLREFITRNLVARGFDVDCAGSGLEGLALFGRNPYDLIILDIMMPHMDGLEMCRRIRSQSTIPIIVLTALGEEQDKVKAFDLGADDYLTKPFGVEELLARLRATLRRVSWGQEGEIGSRPLRYGELELNEETMAVRVRQAEIGLTRTEFDLLRFLITHAEKVLPHRLILQEVWGAEYGDEAEYLRVYIGRLRRKIEQDPAHPRYIHTEYGVGYRLGGL